ncbi:hypothetical protein RP20_CCG013116 [Aedes albopictus]|nr:hypothetical protein RP20_CCG013116 [Aedes albopictus]
MTQGGGLQQSSTAEDATQQQIPNIAGTITDTTTTSHKQIHQNHHHHHHPHHAQQYLNGGVHLHQHLPQLHPYSSSVTGGSTGLLAANNGPVSGGAGAGGGGGGSAPSTLTSGAKLPAKTSPIGPSPFRQLLPVALCIISFATVLSILIIYMDTTGRFLPLSPLPTIVSIAINEIYFCREAIFAYGLDSERPSKMFVFEFVL